MNTIYVKEEVEMKQDDEVNTIIHVKDEIEIKQEDEVNTIHINDELESRLEEEEEYNTVYIKEEVPCESTEWAHCIRKSEATEDPLQLDEGKIMMSSSAEVAKKRSRHSCSFTGCGRSKAKCPELHFFSFPVKRPFICELWTTNCANEVLDGIEKRTLTHRVVCQKHFEEECFTSNLKTRLKHDAVPTILCLNDDIEVESTEEEEEEQQQGPSSLEGEHATDEQQQQQPVTPETIALPVVPGTSAVEGHSRRALFLTPEQQKTARSIKGRKLTPRKKLITPIKMRLQLKLQKYKKLNKQLLQKLKRIAIKPKTTNNMLMAAVEKVWPEKVTNFFSMQLSHIGRKNLTWTESEKQQALAMRYKSPALYEQMRKDGFALPSTSTVARWLQAVDLRPGVCPEIMKMVLNKVEHMAAWEKNAVLLFDEMSIKSSLDYDSRRDLIEGLLDLGEDGRRPYPATHVLLFMARGLTYRWKMPIAYFATNSTVDSSVVARLVEKCVNACQTCGLKVRAVVCDQSSVNRKAAKILDVSPAKPYFMVNENKVYFIFDFPHVIKCLRNNLMKRKDGCFVGQISFSKTSTTAEETDDTTAAGAMENGEGDEVGVADWSHLQKLYDIDSQATKSRATKLTEKHLKPNSFEKMSVKLATQVFSLTTSAAMRTAVETGQLPSSALDTAYFLQRINNIFDVMNSKTKFHLNPYKCAISSSTNSHLKTSLQSLLADINWVKSLKMLNEKRRPPCLESIHHSLVAAKLLWHDLDADGVKYLLTGRLNQDPIENEFSVARNKCGYERNPSVRLFRQNLRRRIQAALIQPPMGANCEPDEDELLSTMTTTDASPAIQLATTSHHSEEEANCTITGSDEDDIDEPESLMPSLESCSVRYFTSYGIQTCLRKFNCTDCRRDLLKPPSSVDTGSCEEALIRNREYSDDTNLIYPSKETVEGVDILLSVLDTVLKKNIHVSMFRRNVLLKAKRRIFRMHPDWMKCNTECYNHRDFILNKILVAKLKRSLQAMSKDLRQPGGKCSGKWELKVMKLTNKLTSVK